MNHITQSSIMVLSFGKLPLPQNKIKSTYPLILHPISSGSDDSRQYNYTQVLELFWVAIRKGYSTFSLLSQNAKLWPKNQSLPYYKSCSDQIWQWFDWDVRGKEQIPEMMHSPVSRYLLASSQCQFLWHKNSPSLEVWQSPAILGTHSKHNDPVYHLTFGCWLDHQYLKEIWGTPEISVG